MSFRLPIPPSLDELRRNTPIILPVPESLDRPFWSVMIPTYNRPELLRKTLESVVRQDPGPAEMQIQVLDNGSTEGGIEAVVRDVGGERVEWFREPANIGSQDIFTQCIRRARGRWVHILHDDDMVMLGFYEAYKRVILDDPEVVMVIGQVVVIDEHDRWLRVRCEPPPRRRSRIDDLPQRLRSENCTEYVSTVVRRDAYERVGGFCKCFEYLSDWDLWSRVSHIGPAGTVPRPYAMYRVHDANGGLALYERAQDIQERYWFTAVNIARTGALPPSGKNWRPELAEHARGTAWRLDAQGSVVGRLNQARWAWMLAPNLRNGTFLIKSWLKCMLRNHFHPPRTRAQN